jgi:nitrite reductase (NADH) large subunit
MNQAKTFVWVCAICGYVHYGPTPPDTCPVCDADASNFELQPAEEPAAADVKPGPSGGVKVVVLGAGIAGISAAEEVRKASPEAEIMVLTRENSLPYYRLNLTRYLAGELAPGQLALHPESWYAGNRITLRAGVEVAEIDPEMRSLTLAGGEKITYQRLVLASGANPFVPPVAGRELGGVYTLRTRFDADGILQNSRGLDVVCIGGGLLGLETAGALARHGARVTVLETNAWLMPRQLNRKAAGVFQGFFEKLGIGVRCGAKVKELRGQGIVDAVMLEDGSALPAGMVIFSAGVRPDIALAAQAGLKVNQGIVVDDAMRTSDPDIFAAGDVAEHAGTLYGTWAPAMAQGIIAGASAAGRAETFHPLPRSSILKVLGIDLFSAGRVAEMAGDILVDEAGADSYSAFIFENNTLAGAILLGDTSASSAVKKAMEDKADCASLLVQRAGAAEVLAFLRGSPSGEG